METNQILLFAFISCAVNAINLRGFHDNRNASSFSIAQSNQDLSSEKSKVFVDDSKPSQILHARFPFDNVINITSNVKPAAMMISPSPHNAVEYSSTSLYAEILISDVHSSTHPSPAPFLTISASSVPSISPTINPTKATTQVPTPTSSLAPKTKSSSISPSLQPKGSPTLGNMNPSSIPYRGSIHPSPAFTFNPSPLRTASPSTSPHLISAVHSSVPSYLQTPSPSSATTAPSSSPTRRYDIQYHRNGTILTGPINLYNIYYGNFNDQSGDNGTPSIIDYFAENIGYSSWYNTVTAYYQINKDKSKTYASHSVNKPKKSINIFSGAKKLIITDEIMVSALVQALNKGSLPVDTNAIYAVIFRGDFTYNGWLTEWCGRHLSITLTDGRALKLFVLGDLSSAPPESFSHCSARPSYLPSANNNPAADAMASLYAQLLVDSVTGWANAWSFPDGEESASVCAWKYGVDPVEKNWNVIVGEKKFLIQQVWLPGVGCVNATSNTVTL